MLLPQFKPVNRQSTKKIIEFRGYNANPVIGDGEIRDGKNLSSSYYPCLAPRGSREEFIAFEDDFLYGNDLIALSSGKIAYIYNGRIFYGDKETGFSQVGYGEYFPWLSSEEEDFVLPTTISRARRHMVVMGDWVCIFPDKVAFKALPYELHCYEMSHSTSYEYNNGDWPAAIVFKYNTPFTIYGPGGSTQTWNTYLRIKPTADKLSFLTSIYAKFLKGEYIKLTFYGYENGAYYTAEGYALISKIYGSPTQSTDVYLLFDSSTFTRNYETNPTDYNSSLRKVTLEITCPDIDYAVEDNNRLWGVKGSNIYASALGSVFNWNKFEGVEDDSWVKPVLSKGNFTGAAIYNGNPIFFKEDYIHQMYGNNPSDFQVARTEAYGVKTGAYKSLVKINDTLFYMSDTGVMAYQGGYPTLISDNFGIKRYTANAAGTDGRKYYISLNDGTADKIFVFDTINRVWHVEDNVKAIKFTYSQGVFQMLNATGNKIVTINSGSEVVAWEAELGDYDEVMDYKKGYSRLSLKVELDPNSEIIVYVRHDRGDWIPVKTISSTDKKYYDIPIAPNRCNSFSIKLSGRGFCKVYALDREFYYGGR